MSAPNFVYRAFDKEKYAKALVNEGRIRLGELRKYRGIEDARRRDATEGEAHVQFPDEVTRIHFDLVSGESHSSRGPGIMHSHSSLGNPIYIFCTSLPEVDLEHMRRNFGKHIVKIGDPAQLSADLQLAMENSDLQLQGRVDSSRVKYTKGELAAADSKPSERFRLSYLQKPKQFQPEREFRFVAIIGGVVRPSDLPQDIDLNLGGRLEYAELL